MASRLLFDFIGPHFLCPAFSRSLAAVFIFQLSSAVFPFSFFASRDPSLIRFSHRAVV